MLSSSSLFLSLSSCCFLGVDCLHVLLSLSSLHGGFLCHALRYFSCSCWAPEQRSHPSPRHLSPQSPPTSWKNRVLSEEVRERRAPSWITRPPTPSPLLPSRQSSRGRSPWRRGLFKKSRRSSGAHQGKKTLCKLQIILVSFLSYIKLTPAGLSRGPKRTEIQVWVQKEARALLAKTPTWNLRIKRPPRKPKALRGARKLPPRKLVETKKMKRKALWKKEKSFNLTRTRVNSRWYSYLLN